MLDIRTEVHTCRVIFSTIIPTPYRVDIEIDAKRSCLETVRKRTLVFRKRTNAGNVSGECKSLVLRYG